MSNKDYPIHYLSDKGFSISEGKTYIIDIAIISNRTYEENMEFFKDLITEETQPEVAQIIKQHSKK